MKTRRWKSAKTHPLRRGWYQIKRPDGSIDWRAWGRGCWWKQLKDGWVGMLTVKWQWRGPRKSIDLNYSDLPDIPEGAR